MGDGEAALADFVNSEARALAAEAGEAALLGGRLGVLVTGAGDAVPLGGLLAVRATGAGDEALLGGRLGVLVTGAGEVVLPGGFAGDAVLLGSLAAAEMDTSVDLPLVAGEGEWEASVVCEAEESVRPLVTVPGFAVGRSLTAGALVARRSRSSNVDLRAAELEAGDFGESGVLTLCVAKDLRRDDIADSANWLEVDGFMLEAGSELFSDDEAGSSIRMGCATDSSAVRNWVNMEVLLSSVLLFFRIMFAWLTC